MGTMVMPERQTLTDEGTKTEFNATEAMIEKFCRSRRAKGSVKRIKFFPSGLSESRLGRLRKRKPTELDFEHPGRSEGTHRRYLYRRLLRSAFTCGAAASFSKHGLHS